MTIEHIINRFLLARCQKNHYEQGKDIVKDFFIKVIRFYERARSKKLGYCSLMKYFGFILLTRSVESLLH